MQAAGAAASIPFFPDVLWPVHDPVAFWTMCLVAATLVLAFVAWRGLKALRLTKKDMITRATRDARACSAIRLEEFATNILPGYTQILEAMREAKTAPFVRSSVQIDFENADDKLVNAAKEWYAQAPPKVISLALSHLNKLEAWAFHFTSGLADTDGAFGPCGATYCRMVVQLCPILLVTRSSIVSAKYPHTVNLFHGWLELVTESERGDKEDKILQQFADIQKKAVPMRHPLPKPIGTEDPDRL